ncbi:hypothetical protein SLA2020_034090 [Shorea laevis]
MVTICHVRQVDDSTHRWSGWVGSGVGKSFKAFDDGGRVCAIASVSGEETTNVCNVDVAVDCQWVVTKLVLLSMNGWEATGNRLKRVELFCDSAQIIRLEVSFVWWF